jgi:hypothetical protein
MYRHCIFCAAPLGANEVIEEFPVGSRLAFDGWKGRLWAVCPTCGRWNLAPIEERWEAVERGEKLFHDAGRRVQSENIGLAALSDGTHLIRVGAALPGELAAWRYGEELQRRRRRYWLQFALMVGVGALSGFAELPGRLSMNRIAYRLPPERSPTGRELRLKLKHVDGGRFGVTDAGGGLILHLPPRGRWPRRFPGATLHSSDARIVLERVLLQVNLRGAGRRMAVGAAEMLVAAGSVDAFIRRTIWGRDVTAEIGGGELRVRSRWHGGWDGDRPRAGVPGTRLAAGERVSPSYLLALEMALHEEVERRALEGELELLKTRWQEAEEIASIADSLPTFPSTIVLSLHPADIPPPTGAPTDAAS